MLRPTRMRAARCFRLEADTPTRVALLMDDYRHFVADPPALAAKLELLRGLHGRERIEHWMGELAAGRWEPLVGDLLESHYDPAYRRSLFRNYRDAQGATPISVHDISPTGFLALARELTREHG